MNLNDLALPAGLIAFGVLAFIALILIAAHQLTERRRHDSDDETWPPDAPPPAELERVNELERAAEREHAERSPHPDGDTQ